MDYMEERLRELCFERLLVRERISRELLGQIQREIERRTGNVRVPKTLPPNVVLFAEAAARVAPKRGRR